jgi:hypothetical protein
MGSYLAGKLGGAGLETVSFLLNPVRGGPDYAVLESEVSHADLVVLVSPVYVDSLPGPVVRAMEQVAMRRTGVTGGKPAFAAVVCCGFPEPRHTELALAMCKIFSDETGMRWLGGLGFGMGETLGGKTPDEAGGTAFVMRLALDIAAEAWARLDVVPDSALRWAGRQRMPSWIYRHLGNWGWNRTARKTDTLERMRDKPYEDKAERGYGE